MPNVLGKTYGDADKVLVARGVKVHNIAVNSPKPAGIVVSTSPTASTSVPVSTTIVVRYSSPPSSAPPGY